MKKKKLALFLLVYLMAIADAEAGGTIKINTANPPYSTLSNVVGTTNGSDDVIQSAGATQVADTYRLMNEGSLPAGSTFTIVWQDGSSETIIVDSTTSSLGAVPVPSTQQPPPSSSGGGGPSGDGSTGDGGDGGTGDGGGGDGCGDGSSIDDVAKPLLDKPPGGCDVISRSPQASSSLKLSHHIFRASNGYLDDVPTVAFTNRKPSMMLESKVTQPLT